LFCDVQVIEGVQDFGIILRNAFHFVEVFRLKRLSATNNSFL
jgi:hypothetical protein